MTGDLRGWQAYWDRHWKVVHLRQAGLKWREVAAIMGVSIQRCCKMHDKFVGWRRRGLMSPLEARCMELQNEEHLRIELRRMGWYGQTRRNALILQAHAKQIEDAIKERRHEDD